MKSNIIEKLGEAFVSKYQGYSCLDNVFGDFDRFASEKEYCALKSNESNESIE